jgi:hypothetical protein
MFESSDDEKIVRDLSAITLSGRAAERGGGGGSMDPELRMGLLVWMWAEAVIGCGGVGDKRI